MTDKYKKLNKNNKQRKYISNNVKNKNCENVLNDFTRILEI